MDCLCCLECCAQIWSGKNTDTDQSASRTGTDLFYNNKETIKGAATQFLNSNLAQNH